MKRKYLGIGISIIVVVILILTSLSNVVGYQTVKSSNQQTIKETVNQRELLFQTICDIVNNKDIQRIILKSQISRGIFPSSEIPAVTKTQLKMMYFLGLILSKVISKSRMHSITWKYQFKNQDIQKEINAVIEKDATLSKELIELSNFRCECEKKNTINWSFPIICKILYKLITFVLYIYLSPGHVIAEFIQIFLILIIACIAQSLSCWWY